MNNGQTTQTGLNGRFAKYLNEMIPVDADMSIDEIKAGMATLYPELASATAYEEDGVIRFMVEAGEKGAEGRFAKYLNEMIPVDADMSIDEIKAGMATLYPELASATAYEEDGVIRFMVEAGEKGAEGRFAKYLNEMIPVDADMSIDEIKAGMATLYPELASATAYEEDGVIRFMVEAGEKGSFR